jgi:hypothetical protein
LRDQRETESSSFSSIVLVLDYDYEDDDEDDTNKNAFNSAKRGMKASDEILSKTVRQAGLILLFDGEAARNVRDRDEHSQTGILTPASNLIPPSHSALRNSGLGICSRYSGATVPDSHRVP